MITEKVALKEALKRLVAKTGALKSLPFSHHEQKQSRLVYSVAAQAAQQECLAVINRVLLEYQLGVRCCVYEGGFWQVVSLIETLQSFVYVSCRICGGAVKFIFPALFVGQILKAERSSFISYLDVEIVIEFLLRILKPIEVISRSLESEIVIEHIDLIDRTAPEYTEWMRDRQQHEQPTILFKSEIEAQGQNLPMWIELEEKLLAQVYQTNQRAVLESPTLKAILNATTNCSLSCSLPVNSLLSLLALKVGDRVLVNSGAENKRPACVLEVEDERCNVRLQPGSVPLKLLLQAEGRI